MLILSLDVGYCYSFFPNSQNKEKEAVENQVLKNRKALKNETIGIIFLISLFYSVRPKAAAAVGINPVPSFYNQNSQIERLFNKTDSRINSQRKDLMNIKRFIKEFYDDSLYKLGSDDRALPPPFWIYTLANGDQRTIERIIEIRGGSDLGSFFMIMFILLMMTQLSCDFISITPGPVAPSPYQCQYQYQMPKPGHQLTSSPFAPTNFGGSSRKFRQILTQLSNDRACTDVETLIEHEIPTTSELVHCLTKLKDKAHALGYDKFECSFERFK